MRVTTTDLDDAAEAAAAGVTAIGVAGAPPSSAAGLRPTGAALGAFYAAVKAGDALYSGALADAGEGTAKGSHSYTHTDTKAAQSVTVSC